MKITLDNSDTTPRIIEADEFLFVVLPHRFTNAWGYKSGISSNGGALFGQVKMRKLAWATCRQMGFTAAGHDGDFYTFKAAGTPTVYLAADSIIMLDGERYTAYPLNT